ncbi:hypothetical protein [Paludisphaera borealis]|uniref:Uncharacterized protein n=1 Tax=Paludisphaera borealis TaxID=1387353 RepID=A0A1U7CLM4_9BACT|nr:hypothetical protein [Paludisphaera borealis]APW59817.1 hypothetical protein BSF38_01275 [Paludisphaera borealis]
MKDALTPAIEPAVTDAPQGFDDLEAILDAEGPAPALDRLIERLDASRDYRLLLDALLLKARHELGLPLIQVGKYAELPEEQRTRFEDRYVEALRRVGSRFLDVDDIPTAWAYFRAIGETAPVAAALETSQAPKDPEKLGPIIEVAFHQGANPRRGFELILEHYGACSAITSLEQLGPIDPAIRSACIERLIRHIHAQLAANIRADVVQRGQPKSPEGAPIAQLIAGRDWLFSDESYHIDISHLTSTVRSSLQVTDPEALDLAIDLAEYGRRLSPRLQYDGAPPFERTFEDHYVFLRAVRGHDVDAAIAHFQAKLPAPEAGAEDLESTMPAQVLVNLLVRLDRLDEAIDVAAAHLANVPDSLLACPPLAELCQRSGRLDRLASAARTMNHPVHFLAAMIQARNKP